MEREWGISVVHLVVQDLCRVDVKNDKTPVQSVSSCTSLNIYYQHVYPPSI